MLRSASRKNERSNSRGRRFSSRRRPRDWSVKHRRRMNGSYANLKNSAPPILKKNSDSKNWSRRPPRRRGKDLNERHSRRRKRPKKKLAKLRKQPKNLPRSKRRRKQLLRLKPIKKSRRGSKLSRRNRRRPEKRPRRRRRKSRKRRSLITSR